MIKLPSTSKAMAISVLHLAAATAIYWYLITGGWLTTRYRLQDLNVINLVLALFEPIAVLSVIFYWLLPRPFSYRFMAILCVIQIIIGIGFLAFIALFAFLWHPMS